ncbi:MAG: ATPase [Xanthobacteraceae bacterium]|nr:ATPase [Xanthobacteraceae bacterium]
MKELFDEVAGHSPLDPREASRKSSRAPPRKRFYKDVAVSETPEGFAIMLDGKPVRTPGKRLLSAPVRELADVMAAEWAAQTETIDPLSMPTTRLANSTIDGVAENADAVTEDIAKYFGSDLLFYRASFPDELMARQAQHWDPVLRWAADDLGAHFILTEGIMHVVQPERAVAAARAAMPADAWRLAALHVVTALTGSALLALALAHNARDTAQIWAAAHVDEDWNSQQWGEDQEVAERRAARLRDFEAAANVLKALA